MAESATKPDPAAEASAASGPRLAKDETEKLTTGVTGDSKKDETGAEGGGVIGGAKAATEKATSAVKDNVFAMFGGGTKKESKDDGSGDGADGKKKDEGEEGADEPSGSAKAVREKEEKEKEKGEKGEVWSSFAV